ncbi:MAG TPA: hypothetical protein DCZ92_00595 [Elusimicrobia bacterium]|nr:MAG: hypothetical protein A2016_09900 [Elusimicrobia bacterium GWF2_62_30]HBA59324.1 hypothetical protein [Elusimicrobiota bacterium]
MRTFIVISCLLVLAAPAALQAEAGSSAAQFLSLGTGARSLGLADASTAVTGEADAAFWNPAGLAGLARPEVSYSRTRLPAGVALDFFAVAVPAPLLRGVFAISALRLTQDPLAKVNALNQNLGSFSPHSEAYALSYGSDFSSLSGDKTGGFGEARSIKRGGSGFKRTAFGATLKTVREDLGTRSASTFAFDGGAAFRPGGGNLVLAGAFRNIGGRLRFIEKAESLPAQFAAALAYECSRKDDRSLLLALDVSVPYAGKPYAKLGAEGSRVLTQRLWASARLGYTSRSVSDLGTLAGITAGVGLRMNALSLDLAFQPMTVLGDNFRFGAGWKF